MNSESFAEYLAQPAKLYQLPYQEIKNLVEEYPYAGNLRLMMFIKSKIEQDPSFETHLHQLAAHTFDRDHLYDLNHQQLKEMLDLATGNEEKLELQDLSSLSNKELLTVDLDSAETEEPLTKLAVPTPVPARTDIDEHIEDEEEELENILDTKADIATPVETIEDIEEEFVKIESEPSSESRETSHSSPTSPAEMIAGYHPSVDLIDTIAVVPLLVANNNNNQPQAKSLFSSWHTYQLTKKEDPLKLLRKKAKQSILGFNHPSAKVVAAKSVEQKSDVATETLAKLLEKQGNYEKAIKMYEQLSLLNPDKSRYFAATIEKLKKNI